MHVDADFYSASSQYVANVIINVLKTAVYTHC